MSAELLREAASLMRERAEAASPGPWVQHTAKMAADTVVFDGIGNWIANVDNCSDTAERAIIDGESVCSDQAIPNGDHIASWHPAVALAVADWLEESADHIEAGEENDDLLPHVCPTALEGLECSVLLLSLAVARAYLGSAS